MKIRIACVALFCFLAGFLLVNQARVTEGQSVYVSATAVDEYKTSIESEKQEIKKIQDRIEETQAQLLKYQEVQTSDNFDELSKELSAEVSKYKRFSGYETVQGPGVKVVIDDGTRPLYEGEDVNTLLVHDIDIMLIVNDLKRCGAEAVSVNGQRIVNSTAISCSGYTVRINGQVFARPFIIRAIGDGKRMSGSLISPVGYGTSLKDYGVQFSVELVDDMTIQGYTGPVIQKYMMQNAKGV